MSETAPAATMPRERARKARAPARTASRYQNVSISPDLVATVPCFAVADIFDAAEKQLRADGRELDANDAAALAYAFRGYQSCRIGFGHSFVISYEPSIPRANSAAAAPVDEPPAHGLSDDARDRIEDESRSDADPGL